RKNVRPYLEHAHVLVLSSAWEGFGNVIVEALACGVQVAATDCRSGPAEILRGGSYGRLVPVRDAPALAGAVALCRQAPSDPKRLRDRAGDFQINVIAEKYLEALRLLPVNDRGSIRRQR